MSRTLIWHAIKDNAINPICNKEEVTELEKGGTANVNITLVPINSDLNELILSIFHFEEPSALKSLNVSQLVITKEKKHDIHSFIRAEDLSSISDFVFMIIAAINSRIADIKQYQTATKNCFGLDVRNYAKDEEELEKAIKHYRDSHFAKTYIDKTPDEDKEQLKSIKFTFSNKKTGEVTKRFEIDNFLLLNTIMDRIMKGGGIDPIISANWDTMETNLKQLTAKALLHYFMQSNTPLNSIIKRKAHAHRVIAEIFTLTDSGEVDEATVKKWIERANEKG